MYPSEEESTSHQSTSATTSREVTVSNLWRRVSTLFWQDPLRLWVPILAADVAEYLIVSVGKRLSRIVLYSLLPHSVLTGQPYISPTDRFPLMIVVAAGSVESTSYALALFVYSIAFVLVAHHVRRLTTEFELTDSTNTRRILTSAMKLAVILVGLTLVIGVSLAGLLAKLPQGLFSNSNNVVIELALLASLAAAFAAKPFLKAASSNTQSPREFSIHVSLLAWSTLAAGEILSCLLYLAVSHASIPIPSAGYFHLRAMMLSLVTAVPYIPMMIAITLLAENPKQ